jgi:hypothetical protein
MRVRVDQAGLKAWREVLERAERGIVPGTRKVVSKGALNVKKGWKRRWQSITGLQGLPRTITYDVDVRGTLVSAEIGPDLDKGGQAPLAFIPEYGVAQQNTRPQPGGAPALAEEAPAFEQYLGDLGEELLR